jgi:putative peptide zinc metalloprotease protein
MTKVPEQPALAPSVQLVGEMQGSGFKDRQWLIQRDGHYIQVTELLYRVAEQANGERTLREIAAELTERTDWVVTEDHVRLLLRKLVPLELIATAHGSVALHAKASSSHRTGSLLSLDIRTQIISPHIITPFAKVFQILYAPPVLIPLLLAIAITHGWLYLVFVNSLSNSSLNFFYSSPELLLVVTAITIVSGCFHELGHASAVQYGGGQVRGMGVGFYLILFPVFYADTTDSYQLGRWARVRTALGGFYFHLIFALGLIVLYLVSGQKFLLFGVLAINLGIIIQCLPFVRMDGYWALTDLTGIPDFFSHMRPFLSSILPLRGKKGSKLPRLKLWVKAIFILYTIFTIPVLVLILFLLVWVAPHFLANTWVSFISQAEAFSDMRWQGNVLGMMVSVVRMVFLALPTLGVVLVVVYVLYNTSLNWKKIRSRSRASLPSAKQGQTD